MAFGRLLGPDHHHFLSGLEQRNCLIRKGLLCDLANGRSADGRGVLRRAWTRQIKGTVRCRCPRRHGPQFGTLVSRNHLGMKAHCHKLAGEGKSSIASTLRAEETTSSSKYLSRSVMSGTEVGMGHLYLIFAYSRNKSHQLRKFNLNGH